MVNVISVSAFSLEMLVYLVSFIANLSSYIINHIIQNLDFTIVASQIVCAAKFC